MEKKELFDLVWLRGAIASGQARRIRETADVTYREAGNLCQVPHTAIYRWESGATRPRGEAALRYAQLLRTLEHLVAA